MWTTRAVCVLMLCATAPLSAQAAASATKSAPAAVSVAHAAVLAVADSALMAITAGNWIGLTSLMLPDAQTSSTRERDGQIVYRMRTVADTRATAPGPMITERGFDADVRIAGAMAVVWMPYDLYLDNKWSHCGVDVFTMVRVNDRWRISNLTYSVEQPPACRRHPLGPPKGAQ